DTVTVDGANAEQAENATVGPTRDIVLERPAGEQKPSGPIVLAQQIERWRVDPFGRLLKGNQPPEEDEEEDSADDVADDPDAADEPEDQTADDADGSDDQDAGEPDQSTADAEADTDVDSEIEVSEDNEIEPLELDTDAESWAQLGGWYRQDYAILYKPTGHADTFLKGWLDFAAIRFSKAEGNMAAEVFTELTGKDAQGQCTKCHSVDATKEQARIMQWAPSSNDTSESLFTSFSHQPHLGVVSAEKGCLTCHETSTAKGYLETYKAHDPKKFVSNFAPVKKETCASCHGKKEVRQDCLLCHKYHVNDIITPITQTKIPEK
ncbi:MAG: cytochrome c3 family protein, partial [Pseudomonadota bacterium]